MSARSDWLDESYLFAGTITTILLDGTGTDGRFALFFARVPPGNETPPHRHEHDTETLTVLSGTMTAETPGRTSTSYPGDVVVLPPRQVHRLRNPGRSEASYLLLTRPAGFEKFVRAAGCWVGDANAPAIPMDEDAIRRLVVTAPLHGVRLSDVAALAEAETTAS